MHEDLSKKEKERISKQYMDRNNFILRYIVHVFLYFLNQLLALS